nr:unnamed protein product [Haemonchus contortus]
MRYRLQYSRKDSHVQRQKNTSTSPLRGPCFFAKALNQRIGCIASLVRGEPSNSLAFGKDDNERANGEVTGASSSKSVTKKPQSRNSFLSLHLSTDDLSDKCRGDTV